MYRTVKFKTSRPEDWQFDERGNPVAPGSRELADKIAAGLSTASGKNTEVEQHEYYGWGFFATFNGYDFYVVLNPAGEDCCLTISNMGRWLKRLFSREPIIVFDAFCSALTRVLQQIDEVSQVAWEQRQ